MAAKEIKFERAAQDAILKGVNTLANAVKATLGPRGRNVLIEKTYGAPVVTKDGVTVAKEIELEDRFENMGAQMVKEVASRTSDVAGDGTTTATTPILGHVRYVIQRPGIRQKDGQSWEDYCAEVDCWYRGEPWPGARWKADVRRARIARRVGSARAEKVVLSRSIAIDI